MRTLIQDIKLDPTKLILNYGPPKTGKTRCLATLIKAFKERGLLKQILPVWYFDFDGGDSIVPMLRALDTFGIKLENNDLIRFTYAPPGGDKLGDAEIRPHGQGRDMFMEFRRDFNSLFDTKPGPDGKPLLANGDRFPGFMIVDSWTTLQSYITDFVICLIGHEIGAKNTHGGADWGKIMDKSVEFLKSCVSLPLKTVIIAHEYIDKIEETSEIRVDPNFVGQLRQQVGREFGTVLYSKTKQVGQDIQYVWQTKPNGYIKGVGVRNAEGLALEIPQDFGLVL